MGGGGRWELSQRKCRALEDDGLAENGWSDREGHRRWAQADGSWVLCFSLSHVLWKRNLLTYKNMC